MFLIYIFHIYFFIFQARFVSVSEFETPSPFLSMAMLEAGVKRVSDKHTLGEDDSEDDSEDEEIDQTTSREATVINFLLVQPKSLQVWLSGQMSKKEENSWLLINSMLSNRELNLLICLFFMDCINAGGRSPSYKIKEP